MVIIVSGSNNRNNLAITIILIVPVRLLALCGTWSLKRPYHIAHGVECIVHGTWYVVYKHEGRVNYGPGIPLSRAFAVECRIYRSSGPLLMSCTEASDT